MKVGSGCDRRHRRNARVAALRRTRGASSVTPLPQSFCSPVVKGAREPQLLITSDFPIRSSEPRVRAASKSMSDAVEFMLERRKYQAGSYAVGYQACDDSTPQESSGDLAKCASNAKALRGRWERDRRHRHLELAVLGSRAPDPQRRFKRIGGARQPVEHERRVDSCGHCHQAGRAESLLPHRQAELQPGHLSGRRARESPTRSSRSRSASSACSCSTIARAMG